MGKWPIEWVVVIGLVLLFIAVKFPLLLMEAALLIMIWLLLSTPKSVKEENGASTAAKEHEEYLAEADAIIAEKKVLKPQGSDAFYAEVSRKYDVEVVNLSRSEQPKK